MICWKHIDEFIEPNWEKMGPKAPAMLFWRGEKGAVFGYIRDEELFDYKCDGATQPTARNGLFRVDDLSG